MSRGDVRGWLLAWSLLSACGGGASGQGASSSAENRTLTPIVTAPATEEAAPADSGEACATLTERLCNDIGPTTETCGLVRQRKQELTKTQCDAMLDHYGEVLADLQSYEARNQPLTPEKMARLLDGAAATHGPRNAAITIVLFSDFQCPFCAGAAASTHAIIERYGDKVHLVFRQFPLSFHRNAHVAAEASLAAAAQGKFWPLHDRMFAHQDQLDRDSLTRHARAVGLDVTALNHALDNQTYVEAVDADFQLGVAFGVEGTPTMFLNGTRVPNASDLEDLTARIEATLNTSQSPSPPPAQPSP